MQIVIDAIILALLAAFTVLFISRFEIRKGVSIREWVELNGSPFLSEMFRCDFCLSWWTSLALGIVLSFFFGWLFIPSAVLATPIARYLL